MQRTRRRPILTAAASMSMVLIATGCTAGSDQASFELWGDDVRPELTRTPEAPAVSGREGKAVQFVLDAGGSYSMGAACRNADSVVLEVSSGWQVVADVEVSCGERAFAEVDLLPGADVYVTASNEADWYAVFND